MNTLNKNPIFILNLTVSTLFHNPIIFYPTVVLGYIQIFILEIIYFAPRYPLSLIFGPIITRTNNPVFMHYPYNYILLSRWYHGLESFIYVFINCFFYAAAVATIALIDKNKEIHWKQIFQRIRSSYIHLAAAMLLNVFSLSLLSFLFAIVIRRAEQIRSTAGTYSVIKSIILISAPYMHFLMAILSFSAFAFLIPIIILENKSFFAALKSNFLRYGGLIADVFILSGLTGSLYLPFLLYRSFLSEKWAVISPEISGLWLVLSILVMLIIDAVQWTAITLLYLSKTEVRP